MTARFDPKDLQPGDVLLYCSPSWVSWIIRTFDRAEVSHAAVYLGDDRVAEALMEKGLAVQGRADSFRGCTSVKVRRKEPALDPGLVCRVAEEYLAEGNRYAYEQILLLGVICLTRQLDIDNPWVRRIAQHAMVLADGVLQRFCREDKQPMICSEFVFRCYDEAEPAPNDPYTLEIHSQQGDGPRRRFSLFSRHREIAGAGADRPSPNVHPESLLSRIEGHLQPARPALRKTASPLPESWPGGLEQLIEQYAAERGERRLAASRELPATDVSPADLESAAAGFAESLASILGLSRKLNRSMVEALAAASPTERVRAAIADFVTPGDLDRSPSLATQGTIQP